jgi:hypothetical protein
MNEFPGKDSMPSGQLIVIISWPDDQDRGIDTYGPFESVVAQVEWSDDCIEAASLGYELLQGASYLLTRIAEPFDTRDLMP